MRNWSKTLTRVTAVVAATSLASAIGLVGFRSVMPLDQLKAASSEVGNYLQTVGGIYAVLLAFVVYVVWGQFNDARGYVDQEAQALVDLHRTASGLPDLTRIAIQTGLLEYIDAVLRDEWRAMACHDIAATERVGEKLDRIWQAIHCCQPTTTCQEAIYSEVLSRFNDITDVRTKRLTSASSRVPLSMKMLLYTGGALMVGSMYLVGIEAFWLHVLVTAALAGAIAHVLYLIVELDDAFKNDSIPKTPFESARRAFERATYTIGHHEGL